MALISPFAWLEDLQTQPIAWCLACRQPFFPHLGGCRFWCHELPEQPFYRKVLEAARIDRRVRDLEDRLRRHDGGLPK